MIVIHYSTSFDALQRFIQGYNDSQEELKSQIRQSVYCTAKEIIRLYGRVLIKANNFQKVDPENLPPLRTNNVQLANITNSSSRTIQRHIQRLLEAGIIQHKAWHGTNSSYELWINPLILLARAKLDPIKTKLDLQCAIQKDIDKEAVKKRQRSNCPHTETCNPGNINNIIIGVEKSLSLHHPRPTGHATGNDNERCSPSLMSVQPTSYETGNLTGDTGENGPKNSKGTGENERLRTGQSKEMNAPKSRPERTASLSFYVQMLWILAKNVLYRDTFLTERQEQIAKNLLIQWYKPVPDKYLPDVHQIYLERIGLVRKYLNKDPRRFVQLPYLYFDIKNPNGFAGTKIWYQKHIKRKNEVRNQLILSNQIRRFVNNEKKDPSKRKPPLQLYRECETRVGKLGDPILLQQFHAAILKPPVYNEFYT